MEVRAFVVLELFGISAAPPQRPASHTTHILTTVSIHVFERPHQVAATREPQPTICTSLHLAQIQHPAHDTHTPHTDAHLLRSALAHPS